MENDPDRCVAFDTEFGHNKKPFIATTCDWRLDAKLYNCHKPEEIDRLREPLEDPSITKIAFPYSVDAYTVSTLGIRCRGPWEDPLIAGSLLDENFANRKGLKPMAKRYLGAEIVEAKRLTKHKKAAKKKAEAAGLEFDYSMIPRFVMKPYAIQDSVYPIKLWWVFRDEIKKFQRIYDMEKKVARIIIRMQRTGMRVDREFAQAQAKQYGEDIRRVERDIEGILRQRGIEMPEKLSPQALSKVFLALGIPLPRTDKVNKRGQLITGISTESKFLLGYDQIPIVNKVLLWRFLKKQKGTYFDPLYKRYTTKDDPYAVFFLFSSGARTGRTSAELIQTIPRPDESRTVHAPKLARMAFVPRPGYFFLAVDYKALQMRIFFHYAKAKELIDKVKQGWDPHDAACEMLFGEVEKELRRDTKNIQFGIVFGMGVAKLISMLQNSKARKNTSQLGARGVLEKYYSIVPVKPFMQKCIRQLYDEGKLEMKFESPLMDFHREYHVPHELAYKGSNVLIQGTEAYVVKTAMIRCNRLIRKKGMDVNLLMNVHDELLFEVSRKEPAHLVVKEIVQAMEDRVTFDIPLEVEPKASKRSWGKVKEWKDVRHFYQRRKMYAVA